MLMCGVSGSGKSWVAERLVQRLPGVRIRSDIERKRLANLAPQARTQSGIDSGLYAADRSDALYDHLLGCAEALAVGGERVIVYCRATRDVLAQRIERRNAERRDPSEATVEVLDAQLASYEAPTESEAIVVTLDTSGAVDVAALADRIARSFKP